MLDYIIKTGDLVILGPLGLPAIEPPLPDPKPSPAPPPPPPSPGTVMLPPFPIVGFGSANIKEQLLCVVGDEDKILALQGPVPYVSATYPVPGTGKVTIILANDQIAQQTRHLDKAVILKGTTFKFKFEVISPALFPPPPAPPLYPDSITTYSGTGSFRPVMRTAVRGV